MTVSLVGSILVGSDARNTGSRFIFMAVHSVELRDISGGTTALVSYNFLEDNGTKPPGGDGIKSSSVS